MARTARGAWQLSGATPTYELRDPSTQPWRKDVARFSTMRWTDRRSVGAAAMLIPQADRLPPGLSGRRRAPRQVRTMLRRLRRTAYSRPRSDRRTEARSCSNRNAREIGDRSRRTHDSRIILLITIIVSMLLSCSCADYRNAVEATPAAAHRSAWAGARSLGAPASARHDEIGCWRAPYDMTHSAVAYRRHQAFAADVTTSSDPLASLRSAMDSLDGQDPELRRPDCRCPFTTTRSLDRLVVYIAAISRSTRSCRGARFVPIDLGSLIESLVPSWDVRAADRGCWSRWKPRAGSTTILATISARAAVDNLVDNAMSFSPPGVLVEVRAAKVVADVLISVEDEAGVPADARESIFQRFHSVRPEKENRPPFRLGLAIARATVEGHGGTLFVEDRRDGRAAPDSSSASAAAAMTLPSETITVLRRDRAARC